MSTAPAADDFDFNSMMQDIRGPQAADQNPISLGIETDLKNSYKRGNTSQAWNIGEYESWLDNPEIGPIVFQFGTRPVVTKEYPVSDSWKQKLLNLVIKNTY